MSTRSARDRGRPRRSRGSSVSEGGPVHRVATPEMGYWREEVVAVAAFFVVFLLVPLFVV